MTKPQSSDPLLRWHTLDSEEHPCSYLDARMARTPLCYPSRMLTAEELDGVLAEGKRRSGFFFYHTACIDCQACEPSRLHVPTFKLNATRRRIERKGMAVLSEFFGAPKLDQQRLALFNLHRSSRGLNRNEDEYTASDMEGFLVNTSCPTLELSFWIKNRLAAVSIVDCGADSLSAVYTYFDPEFSHLSLGTYAIIRQLRWAERTHRNWLYLGMYVAQNRHLNYKGTYLPQQRFKQGNWDEITTAASLLEEET